MSCNKINQWRFSLSWKFLELQGTLCVHTETPLNPGSWSSSSLHGFLRHVCPYDMNRAEMGEGKLMHPLLLARKQSQK